MLEPPCFTVFTEYCGLNSVFRGRLTNCLWPLDPKRTILLHQFTKYCDEAYPWLTRPTRRSRNHSRTFSFGFQRRQSLLFTLPSSPFFLPACFFCLVSYLLKRLSLHGSPNWKIMDLINWSLSEIDTIFTRRSLGSGEPVCPDGTFAAGYTRDAWERWQIVCLAALSVEDAEDIYLFGTMITADWIRLCPGL